MLTFQPKEHKIFSEQEGIGAWLSLVRALGSGPRSRWFKSSRPDLVGSRFKFMVDAKKQNFYWGNWGR